MHSDSSSKTSGFALVIALSLMAFVLLLLLSITTLVQVEQGSAAISKDQMEAEQNALLALNQAIGVLQMEMGPDQRISANADILDNSGTLQNDNSMQVENPYLVGVWDTSGNSTNETIKDRNDERWEIGDTIDYEARTTGGFRRWLISSDVKLDSNSAPKIDPTSMDLASEDSFREEKDDDDDDKTFRVVGQGTLRPDTLGDLSGELEDKEIWVPLQEISSDSSNAVSARIGWIVLDEGVKARMNQPHQLVNNANPENIDRLTAWDTAGSIGIEAMGANNEFAALNRASNNNAKVSTFTNASLYMNDSANGSVTADNFGPYFHDLSLHSAGVMADVVNGGLKRDLSTLAEEEPTDYERRFLYSDLITGHGGNANADPRWSALLDYIGLYKDSTKLTSAPDGGLPTAKLNTDEWADQATRAGIDEPLPAPYSYRLAPAVAQFEVYLSFMALIPHSANYINNDADPNLASLYQNADARMLHLCATPVVTLYNPYNIPIEFNEMWLVYRDIPLGMRISRRDHPRGGEGDFKRMTDEFIPLAAMNSKSGSNVNFASDGSQRFKMRISSGTRIPITLAPGESQVFSPTFDKTHSIEELSNWASDLNGTMEAAPGYSEGVGLYFDAYVPDDKRKLNRMSYLGDDTDGETTSRTSADANMGMWYVFINEYDTLQIELGFADGTQNPEDYTAGNAHSSAFERNGTFSLELYSEDPNMTVASSDSSATTNLIGRYTVDYNNGTDRTTSASDRKSLLDEGLPVGQEIEVIAVEELAYTDIDTPAVTRVNAKVGDVIPYTIGAFRLGGKVTKQTLGVPYQPAIATAFTNTSVLSGHFDMGEESPTFTNYDFSIVSSVNGAIVAPTTSAEPDFRGRFFGGYDATEGTQYGTLFEVPVTPLQSIASLQHANLAASGYLPQVSHVVGNSWAHPLIKSTEALTTGTTDYGLFDHSYIANTRLWDGYYFSTIANQQSAIDSAGDDFDTTASDFIAGKNSLPNPTFKRHIPEGKDVATATTELTNGSTVQPAAYQKAAAYQMQEGTFNINSTSVDAWKALLATTNIANSVVQHPFYYNPTSDAATGLDVSSASTNLTAVYSRFRIPNFDRSLEASLDDGLELGPNFPTVEDFAIWQGYRELDEDTIDQLANDIVDQIRYRGPFLSMADFVNRRLGDETDPRTQMGTIDAAIAANAAINDDLNTAAGSDIADFSSHITSNDFNIIQNDTAIEGNTARGVPTYLTQADILQQVGSRLSARSDTFVIRAYGEVINPISGEVSASSLCEAVVQRIPDYVDASQEPYFDNDTGTPEPDELNDTNERFGRKFKIVQLNWLNPSDV